MKVLAVGSDREGVRILLFDRTQIIIDTQIRELAAQRNERTLIEAQLHIVHESWSSIDRFIVLSVPHSHTSVRVITTIVRTSAWYLGRSIHILDCETLDQFSVDDLRDYIKRIALK